MVDVESVLNCRKVTASNSSISFFFLLRRFTQHTVIAVERMMTRNDAAPMMIHKIFSLSNGVEDFDE